MSTNGQHATALQRVDHDEMSPTSEPTTAIQTFMPAMTIPQAVERFNQLTDFVKKVMHKDVDYGTIPGTQKDTLLKPGAEKLCTLFGLTKRFTIIDKIEDWSGAEHGDEPLFYYLYRCALWKGEMLIAESDGSCNSREAKYRYRNGERKCPECGKPTIIKGKEEYGGGFICFAKKGGCGAKFNISDTKITGQQVGRVANPDVADQINTIQKMAQKRALIAATLLAVNASEFFTQDTEDMVFDAEVIDTSPSAPRHAPTKQTPPPANQPQPSSGGTSATPELYSRINEWRSKIAKEGVETESVLNEMLGQYGAERVEELTRKDAIEYGTALKDMYERHVEQHADPVY